MEQEQEQDKSVTPQVRTEVDRPARTKRIPFGVPRAKLGVLMEVPGFHLHWVNDSAGRIAEAKQGGYTFVDPKEVNDTGTDSNIKRLVGSQEDGSALYAYLMKIELRYYDEDQKALTGVADEFERAIRRGKLDEKPGEHRYDGGIKIS